jgi:preprotein translocase subunit SecD
MRRSAIRIRLHVVIAIAIASMVVPVLGQGRGFPPEANADRLRFNQREVNVDAPQTTILEIRLAETTPVVGLTRASVRNSAEPLFLHDERLVSTPDVLQARVIAVNGRFNIEVLLFPEGAAGRAQATSSHMGKPVAIIVDGEMVAAPLLRAPITTEVLIADNFTRAEAERIAAGLMR